MKTLIYKRYNLQEILTGEWILSDFPTHQNESWKGKDNYNVHNKIQIIKDFDEPQMVLGETWILPDFSLKWRELERQNVHNKTNNLKT